MTKANKSGATKLRQERKPQGEARIVSALAWARRDRTPDQLAFYDNGLPVTFENIVGEAEELAAAFGVLGLKPGETVSFQLPNWREAIGRAHV